MPGSSARRRCYKKIGRGIFHLPSSHQWTKTETKQDQLYPSPAIFIPPLLSAADTTIKASLLVAVAIAVAVAILARRDRPDLASASVTLPGSFDVAHISSSSKAS
jgi:hypothetical protein